MKIFFGFRDSKGLSVVHPMLLEGTVSDGKHRERTGWWGGSFDPTSQELF